MPARLSLWKLSHQTLLCLSEWQSLWNLTERGKTILHSSSSCTENTQVPLTTLDDLILSTKHSSDQQRMPLRYFPVEWWLCCGRLCVVERSHGVKKTSFWWSPQESFMLSVDICINGCYKYSGCSTKWCSPGKIVVYINFMVLNCVVKTINSFQKYLYAFKRILLRMLSLCTYF